MVFYCDHYNVTAIPFLSFVLDLNWDEHFHFTSNCSPSKYCGHYLCQCQLVHWRKNLVWFFSIS